MKQYKRCVKIMCGIMVAFAFISPAAFCVETISDKGYYAVALERRDAMLGRSVDAVVFTTAGSGYYFIRRLDEDYRLVLNATSGIRATEVTVDNFSAYDAIVKANSLVPRTIRDDSGRELAIVYCGLNPGYIDGRRRKDGSIVLDVRGRTFLDPEIFGVLDRAMIRD